MGAFADRKRALGKRMIEKYGETFDLKSYGSYTRSGQSYTPVGPPVTLTTKLGLEPWEEGSTEFVRNGSMRVWLLQEDAATVGLAVAPGMTLRRHLNDSAWTVGSLEEFAVQGEILAWRLTIGLRRVAPVAP